MGIVNATGSCLVNIYLPNLLIIFWKKYCRSKLVIGPWRKRLRNLDRRMFQRLRNFLFVAYGNACYIMQDSNDTMDYRERSCAHWKWFMSQVFARKRYLWRQQILYITSFLCYFHTIMQQTVVLQRALTNKLSWP